MGVELRDVAIVVSEFLSSTIYCMLGCMGSQGSTNIPVISDIMKHNPPLYFGLATATAMQCFLPICGAFINPSVTIAAVIMGIVNWKWGIVYIISEFLGGFAGVGLAYLLVNNSSSGFCIPSLSVKLGPAICIELILTLIWVFAMCSHFERNYSLMVDSIPLQIGAVVYFLHLCGYTTTGPGLNPPRTLAANVISNMYDNFWVYLVFPPIAGTLGGLIYGYILTSESDLTEM